MKRSQALKLRSMIEKAAVSLPDEDALEALELFPLWAAGITYKADQRIRYMGKLYRCLQLHTSQAQYPPSINTASLYAEIEKPGEGDSPYNPIPYNNNMELKNGKYYIQYNVVYRCIRDTGIPVYNDLADLVGLYVEAV